MCEHTDGVHFTSHEVYDIMEPNDFVKKTGPVMAIACRIVNLGLSAFGGSAIPSPIMTVLSTSHISPLEFFTTMSEIVGDRNSDLQLVRGPALRELEVFLTQNDPMRVLGGQRIQVR